MTASRSPAKRNARKRLDEVDEKPVWGPRPKIKKIPSKRVRGKKEPSGVHEYRVFWNAARESWDVALDGAAPHVFAYDQNGAVALAIQDAQHDHAKDAEVSVQVEQKDGSFKTEWKR